MRLVKPIVFILLILFLWALLSNLEVTNSYLLPHPQRVLQAFINLTLSGKLFDHIGVSVIRVFKGFGITFFTAIPFAIFFHIFPEIKSYFNGALNFLRNVPPLASVPLLILWFGIGEGSKLAIIILASFFPVFLNCLNGLDGVDKRLLEMGRSFGLSKSRQVIHILIPESLSSIVTGLTLGFGYCWRALIGAEMIAASKGIGYMILDAEELARVDIVFAGIITIGILGVIFDKLGEVITSKLMPWRYSE